LKLPGVEEEEIKENDGWGEFNYDVCEKLRITDQFLNKNRCKNSQFKILAIRIPVNANQNHIKILTPVRMAIIKNIINKCW
jgi:hypothetical protein